MQLRVRLSFVQGLTTTCFPALNTRLSTLARALSPQYVSRDLSLVAHEQLEFYRDTQLIYTVTQVHAQMPEVLSQNWSTGGEPRGEERAEELGRVWG